MIRRWVRSLLLVLGPVPWAGRSFADQFEQLDGPTLTRALRGPDVSARASLTIEAIGALPNLLRDSRSALVLARTDQGNPVRLLLVPELRKPGGEGKDKGEPFPVLAVERLDSFDAGNPSSRLASRKDVVLFDGFRLDLDSGQVVPDGQGGDVIFRLDGEAGPRLESIGEARLFTMEKAPIPDDPGGPRPSPGRAVLPGDFAGRFRLFANGQWSGTLDLKVEGKGVVLGRFRSDLNGAAYDVTGQVAADAPNRLRFAVHLPRARQEFDGFLWGEGKGAMAGSVELLGRTFGFFAVREGARYAPEGRDLGPLSTPDADRRGRITIELRAGSIRLDGRIIPPDRLAEALRSGDELDRWVLIRTPPDQDVGGLMRVVEAVKAAGIGTIRFEEIRP